MPFLCVSVSPSCLTSAACLWSCSEGDPPAPCLAAGDPQGLLYKQVWAGFPGRCVGSKVDVLKDTTKTLVSYLRLLLSRFPHPGTLGNGFLKYGSPSFSGVATRWLFPRRRACAYLLSKVLLLLSNKVFFLKSCIFAPSKSQKYFKF